MSNVSLNRLQLTPPLQRVFSPLVAGGPEAPAASLGVDQLVLTAPTTRNRVTLHLTPSETMTALLDSIKNAKHSFYIETFIWHDDEAGMEVARALGERKRQAEAKGETFDAKVLIDSMGMRDQFSAGHFKRVRAVLESYGVEVQVFNPHFVSLKAMGLPLTHRKLYIADGDRFMSGGRNIADEYLKENYRDDKGPKVGWHDLAYTIEGEETTRVLQQFFADWGKAGGKVPATLPAPSSLPTGSAAVQTFVTDPVRHVYAIREAHVKAIKNAKSEIVAMYPYFSDDELVKQLINAKKANPSLSVKVMMPAIKESGMAGMFYALHKETAAQLLRVGIEVRFYHGDMVNGQLVQRTDHLKAMLIDGKLLSIGSANADARSYLDNYELNTLISDPTAIADFTRRVAIPDWQASKPITLDEVNHRTFFQKFVAKILEWVDVFF